jgi:hypothetical protein
MLNGWDLGIRVRGERDHLGVDCNHDEDQSEERGYGNDTYVAWILHNFPVCCLRLTL